MEGEGRSLLYCGTGKASFLIRRKSQIGQQKENKRKNKGEVEEEKEEDEEEDEKKMGKWVMRIDSCLFFCFCGYRGSLYYCPDWPRIHDPCALASLVL